MRRRTPTKSAIGMVCFAPPLAVRPGVTAAPWAVRGEGLCGTPARGSGSGSGSGFGTGRWRVVVRGSLGYTSLGGLGSVSRVAVGTWSWGNRVLYGYDPAQDDALEEAFVSAVSRGVSLFDTADSYGVGALNGRAESLLGQFLARHGDLCGEGVRVATKYASYPWRVTRGAVRDAAARSAERLGRAADLGQIHWPAEKYAPWQERALWDGLADAYTNGFARAVGVSNYGPRGVRRIAKYLSERHGIPLSAVQVQTSLLSRTHLAPNGTADTARALGAGVIGYSPLCLGLLSGKYKPDGGPLPPGPRAALLKALRPTKLLATLAAVAARRNASVAQVAVAWCLAQNVVVLVGARTADQVADAVAAASVTLSADDMVELEEAAKSGRDMIENAFQTK